VRFLPGSVEDGDLFVARERSPLLGLVAWTANHLRDVAGHHAPQHRLAERDAQHGMGQLHGATALARLEFRWR
jgi:hypothetical protein